MEDATRAAHERVDTVLAEHPLENPTLRTRVEKLRAAAKTFSHGVIEIIPESPERDEALRLIRLALLVAVDGAELNQPTSDPRVRAAVIDEATAVAMRDGKFKPG